MHLHLHHELHLTKIDMIVIASHHLMIGVLSTGEKKITKKVEETLIILLHELIMIVINDGIPFHQEKLPLVTIAMKENLRTIAMSKTDILHDQTITALKMTAITSNPTIIDTHLLENHAIRLSEVTTNCTQPVPTDATSSRTKRRAITMKMATNRTTVVELKQPTTTTVPTESDPATKHR